MNKLEMALELKSKIAELEGLINTITDEELKSENEDLDIVDWSEDLSSKTYLELARQDLETIYQNRNNLKQTSHTVTVLIAQCFEKCLCHLLMLKGVLFVPTHSHSKLLRQVKDVYGRFPECFGEVEASLCELWYQTNRYPQRSQRGYESYYLILNMIKICERLVNYCDERDKECSGIEFDFKEYEASRLLSDDEIGALVTRESIKEMKKFTSKPKKYKK